MKLRWAALLVVLALSVGSYRSAFGQGAVTPSKPPAGGALGSNYPNPFNPVTTIPFSVGLVGDSPTCETPAKRHKVTLRIYSILQTPLAVPILRGGNENAGKPTENIELVCGKYEAFWDGAVGRGVKQAASGVLLYALYIDGKLVGTHSMFILK